MTVALALLGLALAAFTVALLVVTARDWRRGRAYQRRLAARSARTAEDAAWLARREAFEAAARIRAARFDELVRQGRHHSVGVPE